MKTATVMPSPSPTKSGTFQAMVRLVGKRKHGLLTLETIRKDAVRLSDGKIRPRPSMCLFGQLSWKRKVRINPLLTDIVLFIASHEWVTYPELYNRYSYANRRSLRRYLNELQRLRWIRRFAKAYHLNPFFLYLLENSKQLFWLIEYATFKIDFFEISNIPLKSALLHKIKTVEITSYPVRRAYFNPIFKGLVEINLILEDGRKTFTFLPYNVHAQSKIVGRQRNKPVVNACGIDHICLPLSWSIFDVKKPSYYSPNRKRSHHKGNPNKPLEYIHFDNSLTIMHQPKGLLYMQRQKDMHRMETDSLKWWNGKGKEYVEFCSFDTLKRLFKVRFVKGKRGPDIFQTMGSTYRKLSR
jgi:hypothetical protein